MALLAFQPAPDSNLQTGPAPITLDFSGVGKALVQALTDNLGAIGDQALRLFFGALQAFWSNLWDSGINIFGYTDPAWTVHFGPVNTLMSQARPVIYGTLFLAIVLMALRGASTALTGEVGIKAAIWRQILTTVFLLSGWYAFMDSMVTAVNAAARAAGFQSFSGQLPGFQFPDPITAVLGVLALMWYGWHLFVRAGYRQAWLGILTAFMPIFIALRLLPFFWCKEVSNAWIGEWLGWLWAVIPSVAALSIGFQMAAHAGGLGGMLLMVGTLQVAHNVYAVMARSAHGGTGSPLALVAAAL